MLAQNTALLTGMLHGGLQLFVGDTNRTISETPMNMTSSRSHCIFTLHVESRKVGTLNAKTLNSCHASMLFAGSTGSCLVCPCLRQGQGGCAHEQAGEDTIRRSKLNLVDLAGSERVSKTQVVGSTLHEAKHINLSLHFLEQVIIALQVIDNILQCMTALADSQTIPYFLQYINMRLRKEIFQFFRCRSAAWGRRGCMCPTGTPW